MIDDSAIRQPDSAASALPFPSMSRIGNKHHIAAYARLSESVLYENWYRFATAAIVTGRVKR